VNQYYILTRDLRSPQVFEFIAQHSLRCEVHLNRVRFWVPSGSIFTEFALRFADHCTPVDSALDTVSGL
jgi:hypothetical protein